MRIVTIVLFALTLGACATAGSRAPVAWTSTYHEPDFAWADAKGTASVSGQAFLKTRGGDVKVAAGNEVQLVPQNKMTSEYVARAVIQGEELPTPDERARRHTRRTIADAEGRFRFDGLPAGNWFVISSVYWEVPQGRAIARTGGLVHAAVNLAEGQHATVVVTR
jgi:uncharacterized Zn-binding protein involved in type VI secretion